MTHTITPTSFSSVAEQMALLNRTQSGSSSLVLDPTRCKYDTGSPAAELLMGTQTRSGANMDATVGTSLLQTTTCKRTGTINTIEGSCSHTSVDVKKRPTVGGNDCLLEEKPMTIERPRVKHEYHDFSIVVDDSSSTHPEAQAKMDFNFVEKLHYLLSDMEKEHLEHIASWQPHGRCFVVRRPDLFETKILPVWFRQTKFASFQRQLNLYGFNRITSGLDKNGYYHERFLRGKRFLAKQIHRMKVKGNGGRKASSPLSEPKFYQMPFLKPSSSSALNEAKTTAQPEPHSNFSTVGASTNSYDPSSALLSGFLSSFQSNQPQVLHLNQQPQPIVQNLLQQLTSGVQLPAVSPTSITPSRTSHTYIPIATPLHQVSFSANAPQQAPIAEPQHQHALPNQQQQQQQLTLQQSALLLAQLSSTIASMAPTPHMQHPIVSLLATQQMAVTPLSQGALSMSEATSQVAIGSSVESPAIQKPM